MQFRNIEFVIQEAFTGIRRNGLMAFASISTIALSLAVLGAFGLIAMGANNFANAQINRFEIAVFVKARSTTEVQPVVEKIRSMSGVAKVVVLDRDKEWTRLKIENPNFNVAGVNREVLPFALDVRVTDPERFSAIAAKIRSMDRVDAVLEGREAFSRVMTLTRVVKALSIAGVLILLITSVFIISNAIKLTLYARRREIRIMQLVGATNQFIRTPLIIEGIFFGAAGAVAAWLLLVLGTAYVSNVSQQIAFLGRFGSGVGRTELALALILIGAAIGAAGSFVSIRRFLHDESPVSVPRQARDEAARGASGMVKAGS